MLFIMLFDSIVGSRKRDVGLGYGCDLCDTDSPNKGKLRSVFIRKNVDVFKNWDFKVIVDTIVKVITK